MAGTSRVVKRAWSLLTGQTKGTDIEDPFRAFYEEINNIVTDLETVRAQCALYAAAIVSLETQFNLLVSHSMLQKNCIVPGFPAGLDIDDTNAENVETNAITYVRYNGVVVKIPIDAELDTSISCTASSDVDTSDKGVLWIYADAEAPATCTCEASHPGATSGETTAVGAARWLDSDHYQRNAGEIPIALVTLTEGGSGAFTWGADSISTETEAFIDLIGTPGVVNDVADIIVTAGANTTWAHGAGGVVLGDGTYVALTAQTALPINNGAAVATAKSCAIMLYVLSDGGAEGLQISTADASHAAALATAIAEVGNPYLACIGFLIVDNATGSAFTPGTTAWNTAGCTTTIYTLSEGDDLQRGTSVPVSKVTADTVVAASIEAADLVAAALTTPESQD